MTDNPVWTPEQVAALVEYQRCGFFHPYTCGGGGGPCSGVVMDPTPQGLVCPTCGRVQTRVHDFALTGQWWEVAARTEQYLQSSAPTGGELEQRWRGMLTQAALDQLWQVSPDGGPDGAEHLAKGCCPRCCAPCAALKGLLGAGLLDGWVAGWPDHLTGTAWWTDANQVDRGWLARAWTRTDCHTDDQEGVRE